MPKTKLRGPREERPVLRLRWGWGGGEWKGGGWTALIYTKLCDSQLVCLHGQGEAPAMLGALIWVEEFSRCGDIYDQLTSR